MRNISKLKKIREQLFVLLFQHDFYSRADYAEQTELYLQNSAEGIIRSNAEDEDEAQELLTDENVELIIEEVRAKQAKVVEKLPEIDSMLEKAISGWKLSRIGKADIAILRLAAYEMKFDDEIPEKVAINEAVELAKQFGQEASASFINGVLAKLVEDNG